MNLSVLSFVISEMEAFLVFTRSSYRLGAEGGVLLGFNLLFSIADPPCL